MSIGQNDSRPKTSARILLVDDNRFGLIARQNILEELGYNVTAKQCPLEALECFVAEPFDLVVTDFRMPHMDGRELIARLRDRRPDLPVVLISGFAETLGLDENSTGADAVIQKSSNEVTNMLRAVDRLIGRNGPPSRKQPISVRFAARDHRVSVTAR